MILIKFLTTVLKDVNSDEWDKFYLSYDNMYVFFILFSSRINLLNLLL